MGITKQYLKYAPAGSPFGVIASSNATCIFVPINDVADRFVACSACQQILVWDTKSGEKVKTLTHVTPSTSEGHKEDESEATVLAKASAGTLLAAGYTSGTVRLFDYMTGDVKSTFTGHSAGVSCLSFDEKGMRLASGGNDTEIVVWDVVNESGQFRLKGHKHVVTQVSFLTTESHVLVSSSRDSFVKFWDLTTQHCFKTLTGHKSEVWDFVLLPRKRWLITGTSDSEMRVWKYEFEKQDEIQDKADERLTRGEENNLVDESHLTIQKVGSILRQGTTPVRCLTLDPDEKYIVVCGRDSLVESFHIRNESQVRAALSRRAKKERKRGLKETDGNESEAIADLRVELADQVASLPPFRAGSKVKFVDVVSRNERCIISTLLTCNAIEIHATASLVSSTPSQPKVQRHMNQGFEMLSCVKNDGHRTDMRTISFSSDNYFILTASADCVKVWSRQSNRCIVSMTESCGYSLCSLFAPGDKNCLIGTKEGNILIYDILSASLLESVRASDSNEPIWCMDLFPNKKGIVTGSEDKVVKFWDFDLVQDDEQRARRLTIRHTRSLQLDEGVLCVKMSPNGKFVAVSLLDSTVKVFFVDTLKFFLNLYGHKFPVLSLDISSDSTLIATGSSDKNIKVWGMDFGDCHKSIFAHEEPITCVKFLPNTHYLFTSGKEGLLKQWDADTFEKIITLRGHLSEVWCFAVSPSGKYVASVSHDRTIRLWEKTSEPLILEEEHEEEREAEYEKNAYDGCETLVPGEMNQETGFAHKKTAFTVRGTELLLEAIDVHRSECESLRASQSRCRRGRGDEGREQGEEGGESVPEREHESHPLLLKFKTKCPDRFLMETIRSIKSSDLDEALLSLPFNYAAQLIRILSGFLERNWEFELVNRCVTFLTR